MLGVVAPALGSMQLGVGVIGLQFQSSRIPVVALLVSASVLVACVVAMSMTLRDLPVLSLGRSRRRRLSHRTRSEVPSRRMARTVTGVRPTLSSGPVQLHHVPLRRPARQSDPTPDTQRSNASADATMSPAERTIEHLLANDPDLLAGIIRDWLRTDNDTNTATSADRTKR